MENKQETKPIFVNSFLELTKVKAVPKITVKDLVSHSNLSRQTFYRHFDDIDDLIYYIHADTVAPVYKLSDSLNDNRVAFKLYLDLMAENKSFYQQIVSFEIFTAFSKRFYISTRENLLIYMFGKNKDTILNDEDLNFALNFYTTSFTNTVLEWIKNNTPYTSEYLTIALVEHMPEVLKKFIPPLYQHYIEK